VIFGAGTVSSPFDLLTGALSLWIKCGGAGDRLRRRPRRALEEREKRGMGLCASSSSAGAAAGAAGGARTVLVSPRHRARDRATDPTSEEQVFRSSSPETPPDRYCRCSADIVARSKSFVCPVCRKIRLKLKNSAKQAIGDGRGADPAAAARNKAQRRRSTRSIERSKRRQEIEEDRAYRNAYTNHGDGRNGIGNYGNARREPDPNNSGDHAGDYADDYADDYDRLMNARQLNPQNGADTDSNYDSLTSNASSVDSDSYRPARQLSSSKFKAVSHKVQEMVELSKFYEMALRKLFRDFDVDNNGFIDAPELCQLIANTTGRAGVYQPLTLQEAETFLASSNRHGDRVIEEGRFIKYMIKYGNNNLSDSLAGHAFGTKGVTAGTGNSMLGHERMTKKIYQFVSITKRRLERRAVSLFQLFYQYCGTHYVASTGAWATDVLDQGDLFNMMNDVARSTDEEVRVLW
jgi:hypothetical protein